MSSLGRELLVTTLSLLLVAGAVYRLGDRHVLVPPPESVAEEFASEMTAGRYQPARSYLSEAVQAGVTGDSLRRLRAFWLSRAGGISDVEGLPGPEWNDSAWPGTALITGAGDSLELRLPVVRQHGLWRLAGTGWVEKPPR